MKFMKNSPSSESAVQRCPFCQTLLKIPHLTFISSAHNPEEKLSAMHGHLLQVKCPVCHSQVGLQNMISYEDETNHLMMYYEPDIQKADTLIIRLHEKLKTASWFSRNLKYRVVTTREDFYEKVRIFDAGLNDRVIEIMKAYLMMDLSACGDHVFQDIRFSFQHNQPVFTVEMDHLKGFYPFRSDDYRLLCDSLRELKSADLNSLVINLEWGIQMLEEIETCFFQNDGKAGKPEEYSEKDDDLLYQGTDAVFKA